MSLNKYVTDTWARIDAILLSRRTREVYAQSFDKHVSPALGHLALRVIIPAVLSRWQAGTRGAGTRRSSRRGRCSARSCRPASRAG